MCQRIVNHYAGTMSMQIMCQHTGSQRLRGHMLFKNIFAITKNSRTLFCQFKWDTGIFFYLKSAENLVTQSIYALLEKQSQFPRNNMECRGKPDTT